MSQRVFEVHRNGKQSLGERIRGAVKDYYSRYRCLPAAVVLNLSEADAAREALEDLDLRMLVEPVPGCLVPEVWLEVRDDVAR